MLKKEIRSYRVTLRPLIQEMVQQYIAQFLALIQKWLHVDSIKSEEEYLQDRIEAQSSGATCFFCVFDNKTDTIVGGIEIRDPQAHRGQLYCWINEAYWGTGYFKEALEAVTKAYFQETGSSFITACVYAHNKRSYYALKKMGFSDLGISRGPYGKQYELILRRR